MNKLPSKKILALIALGLLLFLIFFISVIQTHSPESKKPITTVAPTESSLHLTITPIIPAQGDDYKKSVTNIEKQESPTIQNDTKIGNLLSGLPYQESTFSLKYNFDTNQFIAIIFKENKSKGVAALDSFINSYGLKTNDIKNLVIEYQ